MRQELPERRVLRKKTVPENEAVVAAVLGARHDSGTIDAASSMHIALFLVHGLLVTAVVAELRRARRESEVRAEEAQERAVHPWKRPWSVRQQHADTAVLPHEPVLVPSVRARFGVISDIDDTIIASHSNDFIEQVAVLFGSGVRTGTDVYRALALGAEAVVIGRPYVHGLALGGEDGVRHMLRTLLAELEITLTIAGVGHHRDLAASALVRA